MKKYIVGLFLSFVCALAFAIPSPKDIEGALASGRMQEARGMIAEVLREKPDSARAHLLQAYVLIHADKDRSGAGRELDLVNALDKDGKVRNSALFGRVAAEIDLQRGKAMPLQASQKPVETISKPGPSHPTLASADSSKASNFGLWLIVILVGGVIAAMIVFMRKRKPKQETIYVPQTYRSGRNDVYLKDVKQTPAPYIPYEPPVQTVVVNEPVAPRPAPIVRQPAYVSQPGVHRESSVGRDIATTAAGVVAGSMAYDALKHAFTHGSSYESRHGDSLASRTEVLKEREPEPEPTYSYSSSRSSFSSSTDDNDSWSSRQSSSDSYSSSSDSSSSWDSGSSSSSNWD